MLYSLKLVSITGTLKKLAEMLLTKTVIQWFEFCFQIYCFFMYRIPFTHKLWYMFPKFSWCLSFMKIIETQVGSEQRETQVAPIDSVQLSSPACSIWHTLCNLSSKQSISILIFSPFCFHKGGNRLQQHISREIPVCGTFLEYPSCPKLQLPEKKSFRTPYLQE